MTKSLESSQTFPLTFSSDPEKNLADLFQRLHGNIPIDGILFGFTDNATVTTYWLAHFGTRKKLKLPCAVVHSGAALDDYMKYSSWAQEGSWIRIVNDPNAIIMGRHFMEQMGSRDFSLIQLRSSYDDSKRGQFLIYSMGQGVYQARHLEYVLRFEQQILLLSACIIKDFLLQRLQHAIHSGVNDNERSTVLRELVAQSPSMRDIVRRLERVANYSMPVMITGETGVGKEVLADFIQMHSPRSTMPFVKINCGAIPPTLLDSELFGHEKGAFTGAVTRKMGCFERANHGTLMLDEVGEMPLDVQVRLLRILQSGSFERIGSKTTLYTDVRVIAATNRDMGQLVRSGKFREDLFYRLNVYSVRIPPLRERQEDISMLVRIMLRNALKKFDLNLNPIVSQENLVELCGYPWRGNVRELQNAVESSLINYLIHPSGTMFWIKPDTTHYEAAVPPAGNPLPDGVASSCEPVRREVITDASRKTFDDHVREVLTCTLQDCAGKVHGKHGAAERLGLKASTLWGKLNKYGIKPADFQQ